MAAYGHTGIMRVSNAWPGYGYYCTLRSSSDAVAGGVAANISSSLTITIEWLILPSPCFGSVLRHAGTERLTHLSCNRTRTTKRVMAPVR